MWVPRQIGTAGRCLVWRCIASGLAFVTLLAFKMEAGLVTPDFSQCRQLLGDDS